MFYFFFLCLQRSTYTTGGVAWAAPEQKNWSFFRCGFQSKYDNLYPVIIYMLVRPTIYHPLEPSWFIILQNEWLVLSAHRILSPPLSRWGSHTFCHTWWRMRRHSQFKNYTQRRRCTLCSCIITSSDTESLASVLTKVKVSQCWLCEEFVEDK